MQIETIEDVARLRNEDGSLVYPSMTDKCQWCDAHGRFHYHVGDTRRCWCSKGTQPTHLCDKCQGTGRIVNAMLERCLKAAEGIGVWKLTQTIPKGYGMVIRPWPGRPGKPVGKSGDTPLEAVQAALVAAVKERYDVDKQK